MHLYRLTAQCILVEGSPTLAGTRIPQPRGSSPYAGRKMVLTVTGGLSTEAHGSVTTHGHCLIQVASAIRLHILILAEKLLTDKSVVITHEQIWVAAISRQVVLVLLPINGRFDISPPATPGVLGQPLQNLVQIETAMTSTSGLALGHGNDIFTLVGLETIRIADSG